MSLSLTPRKQKNLPIGAIAEKMPIAMIKLRVSIFDASSCIPVENAIIDREVSWGRLTCGRPDHSYFSEETKIW